jgi:hypothetical protein
MIHPPSEEIRNTFQTNKSKPSPTMHTKACACCHVANPKSNKKELRIFAVIMVAVTLTLVGLNAYQRDRIENETADASHGLGPGATQAAEVTFPVKTPTAGTYTVGPSFQQQQQYAMVPMQCVRPGEPTLQYMAVPYNDGKGTVRLKRVVGR